MRTASRGIGVTSASGVHRVGLAVWVLLAPLLLTACGHAVVFSTAQLVGIELNALEGGQQTAKVAMQRFEGVSMPACREDAPWYANKPCKNVTPQAYATLAVAHIDTGILSITGLTATRITQVFATGTAASAPNAPESVAATFGALEGEVETNFCPDASSDCLIAWLDADDARYGELKEWMDGEGLAGDVTALLFGSGYEESRGQAIAAFGLTCE